MPQYRHAWATITGKVFVELWEIEDHLREKFPGLVTEYEMKQEDPPHYIDKCSPEQEREAFMEIAEEKLRALFSTDDPMKMNEIEIDMKSGSYS